MDLHRVSGEKRAAVVASKPAGVECQPNAAAPLLRDEKARRDWLEHELDMCCQVSLHLSMQSHRPILMGVPCRCSGRVSDCALRSCVPGADQDQ